jgi:hypothetical protein
MIEKANPVAADTIPNSQDMAIGAFDKVWRSRIL